MNRVDVPPGKADMGSPIWFKLLKTLVDRHNMYSGASNPVVSESPQGQPFLYKNTTLNEIRWWVNDNGTMKKSVAFT